MNKIISKIKKIQLNSNGLKLVAIIAMLIDHIGYYFQANMNNMVYHILRAIGRLSMPILAFLLVQGFFHTRDIKKYILRIFSIGIITQICIFVVSVFDKNGYNLSVNSQLNILFSYTLSLITLLIIHEKIIVKKWDNNQNMFLKIFLAISIVGIYIFIPIDYGIYVPLIIILWYFIEKLKITIYMQKQSYNMSMSKIFISLLSDKYIKITYNALIFITLLLITIESKNKMYYYMLFSIIPIYLYNGERGKKDKRLDILLYGIFPVQHFLLYLFSII